MINYIRSHDSDFDTDHLTLSGFSAGANLAMANAVNAPAGTVKGVVSFYGNTDMTKSHTAPDEKIYDSGVILPPWLRKFFYACYILPSQDRADPRLSPAFAAVERWPGHVFLACGTADSLHDAGRSMAAHLSAKGHRDASFESIEEEAHAFDKAPKKETPSAKRKERMYEMAIAMIKRAHSDNRPANA